MRALMLFLLFFSSLNLQAEVVGKIEGLQIENNEYFLYGWACYRTSPKAIRVHVYSGGEYGKGGVHVTSASTVYMAEDELSLPSMELVKSTGKVTELRCDTTPRGSHRFKIRLSESLLAANQGKSIYVHGISLVPGEKNPLILNSGEFRFPPPLSAAPTGCLPTSMAKKDTRNTYPTEFLQAQDSPWVYVAWTWRETFFVETSHSLSIARTKDMINWENTCGEKLSLPITSDSRAVIDPILPESGIINGVKLSFDSQKRPVVTYHKHKHLFSTTQPPVISTQVYSARLEGASWKLHQMTDWKVKAIQVGGGTIPSNPTAPGYNALSVDNNGIMFQSFLRPKADTTGTPESGNWQIVDENGALKIASVKYDPTTAKADTYNPTSGIRSLKVPLEARDSSWKTPFVLKTIRPSDDRWVMLRGDWDGDGQNNPGVFDRKMRRFVIRDPESHADKNFLFGPGSTPQLPLIADWDGDGVDTIGVYDSISQKVYVKNSFTSGGSDPLSVPFSSVPLKDGPTRWHKVNPALSYAITYETLPANNDLPYDCDGVPLKSYYKGIWEDGENFQKNCNERYLSDLKIHVYNFKTLQWETQFVDRVWGIGGAFAFKVFKCFQIIAYYDKDRNVKVAIRGNNGKINYQTLDKVYRGWDSHNYLTLTVDENHHIHLSGDHHVDPLNYWRSTTLDTPQFKRYAQTGVSENRVTYPSFFRSPQGDLLFQYRDGESGNGDWIINRFDVRRGAWSRLLPTTIFGKQ